MYNRILVPLDGSKLSECSLAHVKHIMQGNSTAEVILLTVHGEVDINDPYPYSLARAREISEEREKADIEIEQKLESYLSEKADSLKKENISVKTYLIHPEPLKSVPEIIINYAEENKVDLIVMSTHGRSGVSRWAFGSVADKVVHYSKIPVLTVTPAQCRV